MNTEEERSEVHLSVLLSEHTFCHSLSFSFTELMMLTDCKLMLVSSALKSVDSQRNTQTFLYNLHSFTPSCSSCVYVLTNSFFKLFLQTGDGRFEALSSSLKNTSTWIQQTAKGKEQMAPGPSICLFFRTLSLVPPARSISTGCVCGASWAVTTAYR